MYSPLSTRYLSCSHRLVTLKLDTIKVLQAGMQTWTFSMHIGTCLNMSLS